MPDLDPQMSPGQQAAEQVGGSMPDGGTGSQRIVEGRVIQQSQYLPRPWKARQAERYMMEERRGGAWVPPIPTSLLSLSSQPLG